MLESVKIFFLTSQTFSLPEIAGTAHQEWKCILDFNPI